MGTVTVNFQCPVDRLPAVVQRALVGLPTEAVTELSPELGEVVTMDEPRLVGALRLALLAMGGQLVAPEAASDEDTARAFETWRASCRAFEAMLPGILARYAEAVDVGTPKGIAKRRRRELMPLIAHAWALLTAAETFWPAPDAAA